MPGKAGRCWASCVLEGTLRRSGDTVALYTLRSHLSPTGQTRQPTMVTPDSSEEQRANLVVLPNPPLLGGAFNKPQPDSSLAAFLLLCHIALTLRRCSFLQDSLRQQTWLGDTLTSSSLQIGQVILLELLIALLPQFIFFPLNFPSITFIFIPPP